MKSFFLKSSLILLITLVFFEISGFIFSYFKIIPRGSPAVISLFANKDWSLWHPTNIKFKHHYNTCWEPSEIFYNNIGARGKNNVYLTKEKKRIALVGDSMTEMIHVTEGEDIGNLLKNQLPKYEIINFGSRGMGLFDQLELYKGLIKNYNVDYVILYITENDFENNFAVSQKTKVFNQPKFFVDKNSQNVIKIDRDYSKLNEQYFSKFNKLKRSKIILYFKEYSYTFKTYFHIKTLIRNYKRTPKSINQKIYKSKKNLFDHQKKVYEYLVKLFVNELNKDNVKLIPIFNLRSYLFDEKDKLNLSDKLRFESFYIMREIWEKHDPYYLINEAKQFINLKNSQIKEPFKYLGHVCDDHYSKFGSEFISMETVKIIKNLELN